MTIWGHHFCFIKPVKEEVLIFFAMKSSTALQNADLSLLTTQT